MSHIHIPDGVLPLWLVALGWVLTAGLLALVSWRLQRIERGRQLPLLGVMAAVMLVGMSVEIVPIAYHVNLSVLAGIVLGPTLGFLAAFIVNLMLALFGHGGITVAGLNTLVLGAEIALGYYLFRGIWSLLRDRRPSPAPAAALATVLTLLLSTLLMVAIVGLSNLDPASRVAEALGELSFRNPFEHGLIAAELPGSEAEHPEASGAPSGELDLLAFTRLVVLLGLGGWLLESALVGAIVGFVFRVRPDLIDRGFRREVSPASRRAADRRGGLPGVGEDQRPPRRGAG